MSIKDLVETYVALDQAPEPRATALNGIIALLSDHKGTLQEIVTALGPALTNPKEFPRARGTLLLAELLTQYTAWQVPAPSIQYLAQFFADRLQDYPCQPEVLRGIKALLQNQPVQSGDDQTLIRAIFNEIHVQSMSQPVRKTCYEIFGILLDRYLMSMRMLGADFVFGFIQAMDGEKDPRNLLLCFRITSKIVQTIPEFIRFDEDLFEVTSCYFPITFTEKATDPESISKKDLIESLRDVISSTPVFAPQAIPFLLEKLESTNPSVKVDVLLTLSQCVQRFGGVTIGPFVVDLWGVIRSEVMTGTSAQSNEAALTLLRALVKALADAPASHDPSSGLSKLHEVALSQCLQQLKHYESKLSLMATNILRVISHASSFSASLILEKAFPIAFDQYSSTTVKGFSERDEASSKRQILLKIIIELMIASQHYPAGLTPHPLQTFVPRLFEIFSESIRNDAATNDEKVDAVSGLAHLELIANGQLMSADQKEASMNLFSGVASASLVKHDNVILAAGKALELIAVLHSDLIVKIALPKLFDYLKSSTSWKLNDTTLSILTDLAKLQPVLFEQVLSHLVSIISKNVRESQLENADAMIVEDRGELFIEPILSALAAVLKAKSLGSNQKEEWSTVSHVPGACLIKILEIFNSGNLTSNAINTFLRLLPTLSSTMMLQTPPEMQLALLKKVADLILSNLTEKPRNIVIYAAAIRALHKSLMIPQLSEIVQLLLKSIEPAQGKVVLEREDLLIVIQAIATLVNKSADEAFLNSIVKEVFEKRVQILKESTRASEDISVSSDLVLWLTKALIMRNHPKAVQIWTELQNLLTSAPLESALYLANGYVLLFEDSEYFSNNRLIYKQKFFNLNLPTLVAQLKDKSIGRDSVYLIAISNLMRHLPTSALLAELQQLLPIIIESLKVPLSDAVSNDAPLQLAAVATLKLLIKETPDAIADHLNSIITALLGFATEQDKSPLALRLESVEVLMLLSTLPYVRVQRFKQQVIRGLKPALDDRKRVVRREAIKTSNEWAVLSAEGVS